MNVELLGFLLEFVFYAWLCDGLRRTKAAAWLLAVGFGAIVIWVGAIFIDVAFWNAMLNAGKRGLPPEPLSALRDIAQETYYVTTLFDGVALLAINWAAIQSRALPAWLSWAGLLIGAGMVIPNATIAQGAEALVVLWSVSLAGLFLIRPRRYRFTASAGTHPPVSSGIRCHARRPTRRLLGPAVRNIRCQWRVGQRATLRDYRHTAARSVDDG